MRSSRIFLIALLTLALPAAVAWLVFSIVRLIKLTDDYHIRVVIARQRELPLPTTMQLQRMDDAQKLWGTSVMFAIVGVFGVLLVSMIVWLLGQRRPQPTALSSR